MINMERLKDSIKHLTTIIQEVAEEAQNQQKHYYDQAHRPHSFKIGDHVTLKTVTLPGHVKKLTPKAKGPFIIKQFVYDEDEQQQAIIIEDTDNKITKVVSMQNVQKYMPREHSPDEQQMIPVDPTVDTVSPNYIPVPPPTRTLTPHRTAPARRDYTRIPTAQRQSMPPRPETEAPRQQQDPPRNTIQQRDPPRNPTQHIPIQGIRNAPQLGQVSSSDTSRDRTRRNIPRVQYRNLHRGQ